MKRLHPNRRAEAGFTLIEVMLSVLIMSFLLVTITQILTQARATRDHIYNMRESQLAGPAILDAIEADLRTLNSYNRDPQALLRIRNRTLAGKDADRIDFVCGTNGLLIEPDPSQNRYIRADVNEAGYCLRVNPDDDDFLEIFRRETFGVDEEPFDGGRYSFFHNRIYAFNIEVFEEDGLEAEPVESESWNDTGDEHQGLPARIEITLTLEFTPRITREQLFIDDVQDRIVTYRRIIRFPENLRLAAQLRPLPVVPVIEPPRIDQPTAGDIQTESGGGLPGIGGLNVGGEGPGTQIDIGSMLGNPGGGGGGGGASIPIGGGG